MKNFSKAIRAQTRKIFDKKIIKTIKIILFSYTSLESKVEIKLVSSNLIANSYMCSNKRLFGKKLNITIFVHISASNIDRAMFFLKKIKYHIKFFCNKWSNSKSRQDYKKAAMWSIFNLRFGRKKFAAWSNKYSFGCAGRG